MKVFNRFAKKSIKSEFVVIDSQFPQKKPLGFRNSEINEYFKKINGFESYTMHPMQPGPEAWFRHGYGIKEEEFKQNKDSYIQHYPQNKTKINYLSADRSYDFKLAYSFFLAETYVLLPFYEKNKVPFIFVLYPGGAFGLNNKSSDEMLRKIFQSPLFRGVIVTQKITEKYIVQKNLVDKKWVHYIYGGFVQFKKEDVKKKKYYKKDKKTFDICFVAAKYSDKGADKGYDLFIETARRLVKITNDVMFHIVGGFTATDINVSDFGKKIKFYGYRQPDFLLEFYSNMDIFFGPGRPFILYYGNFDGFPLGIDASYCGVALFVADELKMNKYYEDNKDIIILPLNSEKIADKILQFYNHPEKLYNLSERGSYITQRLFDIDYQINSRMRIFSKYLENELN